MSFLSGKSRAMTEFSERLEQGDVEGALSTAARYRDEYRGWQKRGLLPEIMENAMRECVRKGRERALLLIQREWPEESPDPDEIKWHTAKSKPPLGWIERREIENIFQADKNWELVRNNGTEENENTLRKRLHESGWNESIKLTILESMILAAQDFFATEIRRKLQELAPDEDDAAALPAKKQAKLQAFAANLHAELTAKIHDLAGRELILAYLADTEADPSVIEWINGTF